MRPTRVIASASAMTDNRQLAKCLPAPQILEDFVCSEFRTNPARALGSCYDLFIICAWAMAHGKFDRVTEYLLGRLYGHPHRYMAPEEWDALCLAYRICSFAKVNSDHPEVAAWVSYFGARPGKVLRQWLAYREQLIPFPGKKPAQPERRAAGSRRKVA